MLLSGCALFGVGQPERLISAFKLSDKDNNTADSDNVPTRNLVRMNANVVTQPASDRRIRKSAWEGLDESGVMAPADRQRLNRSGFRVGVSGTSLPWAVTSLAKESREYAQQQRSSEDQSESFPGAPILIPDGSKTQFELRSEKSAATAPSDIIPELPSGVPLENLRCVMSVEATEYGEGWIVLKFLPQIRFGATTSRYSIEEGREQFPVRQRILPLYEQQFELKLHVGDTVVVGHQHQKDQTVGQFFFQTNSVSAVQESMLMLRLNAIDQVSGQKSLVVEYGKY